MKKVLKQISAFLLTLLLLLSFAGCARLDQMRQQQVFANADGSIQWNNCIYKRLPDCEYLAPDVNYISPIYLTEPDVPVLLSQMIYIDHLFAGKDDRFLTGYWYESTNYCREDVYDDICARILAPFTPDIVCYSYPVYDEETYEMENRYCILTPEQVAAINQVMETTQPVIQNEGWNYTCEWAVTLLECSQDMLFRREYLDIAINGSTYQLVLSADGETLVYSVPQSCNNTFDEIVRAYRNYLYGD